MKNDSASQFSKSLSEYIFRLYGKLEECPEVKSPIEALMYFSLSVVSQMREGIYLSIHTQKRIGRYCVDFLITATENHALHQPRLSSTVIVECDGHEFHEKTKDQARKDKQRDRFLQSQGFPVLRFTGSEIWSDCMAKADEVLEFLESEIQKKDELAYKAHLMAQEAIQ